MKKALAVFAHPDDESFAFGGTIAKYAKTGWRVTCVCMTNDPRDESSIRKTEMQIAAEQLGVHAVLFLEYEEGKLSSLEPGELEDKLLDVYNDERPDIVVTMEPTGMNNNPDHIRTSISATYAFQRYAAQRHDEDPTDEMPPKLYYTCLPESIVSYFVKQKYFPAESFGRVLIGTEDKRITTIIDISRSAAAKKAALSSYVSQSERIAPYLTIPNNPFLKHEYCILRMVGETEVFMGKNDEISDRL